MGKRTTVTPGHVVENGKLKADENKTALDSLQEPEDVYQPDMAPIARPEAPGASPGGPQASQNAPEASGPDTNTPENLDASGDVSGTLCLVVLRNGASFWHKGRIFKNGEANAVDEETAERLVRSGYFERG